MFRNPLFVYINKNQIGLAATFNDRTNVICRTKTNRQKYYAAW